MKKEKGEKRKEKGERRKGGISLIIKKLRCKTMNSIAIRGTAYFASDFHFGAPDVGASRERETAILRWLDEISSDCDHLFLLGDIFDFWFEYRDVVPKGYFRFFSKLLEMKEKGTEIYYFTGNHDMWVKCYFADELGVQIFRTPQEFEINGKRCYIGHGDGLDSRDRGYLLMKKIFAFKPNIMLYGALPPRWAFSIARFCSRSSRAQNSKPHSKNEEKARKQEQATLEFIRNILKNSKIDYFIFGHRHLPMQVEVAPNVTYFNTGDWLKHNTFLRLGGDGAVLKVNR